MKAVESIKTALPIITRLKDKKTLSLMGNWKISCCGLSLELDIWCQAWVLLTSTSGDSGDKVFGQLQMDGAKDQMNYN